MPAKKKCTKCLVVKSFTQFHHQAQSTDGLTCYCKSCVAQYGIERRKARKYFQTSAALVAIAKVSSGKVQKDKVVHEKKNDCKVPAVDRSQLAISAKNIAKLLDMSVRNIWAMDTDNRLGPVAVKLGDRTKRWDAQEIRYWWALCKAKGRLVPRGEWLAILELQRESP